MKCMKCKKEISKSSLYCRYCGKKQAQAAVRRTKREHGTGTTTIDERCKNRFIVRAPADSTGGRAYLGSYPDIAAAQRALDSYIKHGRPELFNATVEDIYRLWSQTHYKNIKKRTADCYRSTWKHFAPIAKLRMSEIRTLHLQSIIDRHSGRGASAGIKSLAKALCAFAAQNDIIEKNYADYIKVPKVKKTEKKIFSAEQISELWKNSSDKKVQAIIFMIYMGFRIGEMTSLTSENVDLEGGCIVGGIKTEAGRNRVVPFPEQIPEIKAFAAEWVRNAGAGNRLFPITEHTFRVNVFYAPLIKLGMIDAHIDKSSRIVFHNSSHLTPHSTRHTFASLSAAAGIQPERLQRLIGHASFRTTADYYIHTDNSELIAEMGKLIKDRI